MRCRWRRFEIRPRRFRRDTVSRQRIILGRLSRDVGLRHEFGFRRRRLRRCEPNRLVTRPREAAGRCQSRSGAVRRRREWQRVVGSLEGSRSRWIPVESRRTGGWCRGRTPAGLVHCPRWVRFGIRLGKWLRLPGAAACSANRRRIIGGRWQRLGREGDLRAAGGSNRRPAICGAADTRRPDESKASAGADDRPQQQRQARLSGRNDEILSRGACGLWHGLRYGFGRGLLHRRVPGEVVAGKYHISPPARKPIRWGVAVQAAERIWRRWK